jgi:hypothetical protein
MKSAENFLPNLCNTVFDNICKNESVQDVVLGIFEPKPIFQFKKIHSVKDRQLIFKELHEKHPFKIPIIVEAQNKKVLKFLMDHDEIVMSLLCKIREQYKFCANKSIFLMTDQDTLVIGSQTIGQLYRYYLSNRQFTDDFDNILYLMVYNENTFG